MSSSERIREALAEIVDPCSAATGSDLDIVEMGLVKAVDLSDGHATVELRLTTPACHMVAYFVREVETRLRSLPAVESVDVETDNGTEWTAEMMSADAKRQRQRVLDDYESQYG